MESGTHVKSVKITLNIFAVQLFFGRYVAVWIIVLKEGGRVRYLPAFSLVVTTTASLGD